MYGRRRQRQPTPFSCLENPMDGGAWWAAVHGVTKSQTRLSNFTFTFHFHALEKAKATHSSVLAWRIPGTGEPGGLLSMGSHRVGHDWSDLAAAAVQLLDHMVFSCFLFKQVSRVAMPFYIPTSKTCVIQFLCPFTSIHCALSFSFLLFWWG